MRLDLFQTRDERSITAVPAVVLLSLFMALALQLTWRWQAPPPQARAEALPPPPSQRRLEVLDLGDPIAAAKLLMLWLQAFDSQPGVSLPFRALDYTRVRGWLGRILDLDPRGQYPLLAATRLYGEIPVPEKQRLMLEFVYERFLEDPNRRWMWLAHAAYLARHRLKDLPLALKYARALARHATGPQVPGWARQMQIFLLEDMGEIEAAKVLLGGLLASGSITDPNELRFLKMRLEELERAQQN